METKDILRKIREDNNLTQDQMAEKIMVTRQAVSRWELGETQPNTDTLKILSKEFNVSINTLLGSPVNLVCQCCGMPLTEGNLTVRSTRNTANGAIRTEHISIRQRMIFSTSSWRMLLTPRAFRMKRGGSSTTDTSHSSSIGTI